jgi:membrane protease YdiL (CAAX protease family)
MEAGRRVWGWISGFLLGAVIIQLIVISTRAVDFPTGQIGLVEQIRIYPAWTVLPLIAMISLVAGITEEAAFRGYMQKPLEMHYGPKLAIVVVALLFTLIHLPNATVAPHLLPLFFFGSLGWGVLAYLTDSIIPGVVVHAVVDLIGFTWTWTYLDSARAMAAASVMRDGIDASFTILLATAFATTAALIVSFYKLSKVNE